MNDKLSDFDNYGFDEDFNSPDVKSTAGFDKGLLNDIE